MICRACRVQAEHRIIIRKRGNNKLCNSSRLNVLNSNKGKKRAFNKTRHAESAVTEKTSFPHRHGSRTTAELLVM